MPPKKRHAKPRVKPAPGPVRTDDIPVFFRASRAEIAAWDAKAAKMGFRRRADYLRQVLNRDANES